MGVQLQPELKTMLASATLRAELVRYLDARLAAAKDDMLRVSDHPTLMQLQGRAIELDDLRRVVAQEK